MLTLIAVALALQVPAKTPPPSPMFGSFVLGVGDLDGDKVADFLIGDSGWDPETRAAHWVLSGKTALELCSFHAEDAGVEFPLHIYPAGDADADDIGDLWIVSPPRPKTSETRIALWSGKSRAMVREATSDERERVSAREFGDFDRDGVLDKLQGTSIHSGKDGSKLYTLPAEAELTLLLDDIGGDGRAEVLCARSRTGVAQGDVALYSSRDGHLIWDVMDDDYWYFGATIDVVGDLDGDGIRDWIVGGDNHRSHENGVCGLRSGRTGDRLASFRRSGRGVMASGPLFAK
jgi:hypothetical protein